MRTEFKRTAEIIEAPRGTCPLPLDVIPNHLGINLCSVEGVSWTKQSDGQLVSVTIHFVPAASGEE